MSKIILKILNTAVSIGLILCLFISGAYAAFALWDNSRVYAAAGNVQADMIKLKPQESEEEGASFEELLEINPDVRAWLSIDGTRIDYPVLQGENSLCYINTDVYGEFSLSGSIFMDPRNSADFSDCYNLLYGHHMDGGFMFGDLDKFKDEKKFESLGSGSLILPDRSFELEVFACFLVPASDNMIFEPDRWKNDISQPVSYARENQLFFDEAVAAELEGCERPRILVMSTCSAEFTDARTVVMAVMRPAGA